MKVSLIIAAYDRPELLEREIKGILAQTLQDWEMIILDESTGIQNNLIVKSFGDPRIIIKPVQRLGDWGYTVKEAETPNIQGQYVCFGNDDNEYDPTFFEKMSSALDSGYDLVICDFKWNAFEYKVKEVSPEVAGVDLGAMMMKKHIFIKFGFDKGTHLADGQLAVKIAKEHKWHRIAEPLFTHH